jgi:hypothetical protein
MQSKPISENPSNSKICILLLTANPTGETNLRLDEELREIDQRLQAAKYRDHFHLEKHGALRVSDIQQYLLRHQPEIVHFSGHGTGYSELIFENQDGLGQPVPGKALTDLFGLFKETIRCVVLNACFSQQQAEAIAQEIDFSRSPIHDFEPASPICQTSLPAFPSQGQAVIRHSIPECVSRITAVRPSSSAIGEVLRI